MPSWGNFFGLRTSPLSTLSALQSLPWQHAFLVRVNDVAAMYGATMSLMDCGINLLHLDIPTLVQLIHIHILQGPRKPSSLHLAAP